MLQYSKEFFKLHEGTASTPIFMVYGWPANNVYDCGGWPMNKHLLTALVFRKVGAIDIYGK
jgi:hypothetical protein